MDAGYLILNVGFKVKCQFHIQNPNSSINLSAKLIFALYFH